MESGLEDRNNTETELVIPGNIVVSMESGLEDRNNMCGMINTSKGVGMSQWSPA